MTPQSIIESATRKLVTDPEEAISFIRGLAQTESFGIDCETSCLDYPKAFLVGASFYNPDTNVGIYIPFRHFPSNKGCLSVFEEPFGWNLGFETISDSLQYAFSNSKPIFHNGSFDQLFFVREGMKFHSTQDSYILAAAMQATHLALKTLVLEYRLVKHQDVLTYSRLISEIFSLNPDSLDSEEDLLNQHSFASIDMFSNPRAVTYAVNDAIYVYHLYKALEAQYREQVSEQVADITTQIQFDANALLAESSSLGYLIDPTILENFVSEFTQTVSSQERKLRHDIVSALGWESQYVSFLAESP